MTSSNSSPEAKFLGQPIPAIDRAGLRQFGLIFAAIIGVLFGVIVPLIFGSSLPLWPWIVVAIFVAFALLLPNALGPFYQIWMRFGVIMNIIMSRVILGTVFVLTVIPTGLVLKLRNKDILNLKTDADAQSYRNDSHTHDAKHLEKPY